MITTLTNAPRTTHMLNLSDTSFATLIDADPKTIKVVESISIACGGADTDVTLVITKGGTDYYVMNAVTVPQNTTYMVTNHHLRLGSAMTIRVKASNADKITAIAITLEQMPQQSSAGGFGSVAGGY